MNPLTDLQTRVARPDGSIVTIIQPGARIQGSSHWRLNESAYRRYESYIREVIKVWPQESIFAVPNGMSPNTFEHRLRDAIQAITLFAYDADAHKFILSIRSELAVSANLEGTRVSVRLKKPIGRRHKLTPERIPNERPGLTHVPVLDSMDLAQLEAQCLLSKEGVRTEPLRIRGKVTDEDQTYLLARFDTAFAYDEILDITTMF